MIRRRGVRRFVVDETGPRRLADVLEAIGAETTALGAGGVWVDGKRAREASRVLPSGSVVEVHPARVASSEPELLGEASGFVVVAKPAELATEPDRTGEKQSLKLWLARELAISESSLHALSRLDVGVSGAVLFATTKAARRLGRSLQSEHRIARRYVGIAERIPGSDAGVWSTPVAGRSAETRFRVLARTRSVAGRPGASPAPAALLALEPVTGRAHQLRIHAAAAGAPLLGDRAHGGGASWVLPDGSVEEIRRIALHAFRLELSFSAGKVLRFVAPIPEELGRLWQKLGGAEDALDDV